jgi:hypothetical protein
MKRTALLVLCGMALAFAAIAPSPAAAQLDNFKCYKAKDLKNPKFLKTTRDLSDQFAVNDGVVEAKKPYMFCNPVSVSGGGINNTLDHLTCYKIKGPKLLPADRPSVEVVNQLGTTQLQAKKAYLLCLPSTKTIIP